MYVIGNKAWDVYGHEYRLDQIESEIPDLAKVIYAKRGLCSYTSQQYDLVGNRLEFSQLPSFNTKRLELFFTSTCNLSCEYCLFEASIPNINMREKHSFFNAEKTRKYLDLIKPQTINLLGGEATLWPNDIEEILQILVDLGAPKKVELKILTNGTKPEVIKRISAKYPNIHWLISLSSDDILGDRDKKAHQSYRTFNLDQNDRVQYRLIVGANATEESFKHFEFQDYVLLKPMNDFTKNYWESNIEQALTFFDNRNFVDYVGNSLRPIDTYGSTAGCIGTQLFEELSKDTKLEISSCFLAGASTLFQRKNDNNKKDFILDASVFDCKALAGIRNHAYERYKSRDAFYEHCSVSKTEKMYSGNATNILEGSLALQHYVDTSIFHSHVLPLKKNYAGIYLEGNNLSSNLPHGNVIIEPIYPGYTWKMPLNIDYNSYVCLFNRSLRTMYINNNKIEGDYSWSNSEITYSDLFLYDNYSDLKNYVGSDLVGIFVTKNPLFYFLVIGYKNDVVAVCNKELGCYSEVINSHFKLRG
jgi:organic radical activating enzyme